jgi:hypothetical protein
VPGTGSLSVFCRQGVVVLAGVVPRGSAAGTEAVRIARETQGVSRVETFFVRAQSSPLTDFEIKEKIKATLVGDPRLIEGRVDVGVYAGHVVLVGVVGSWQKAEDFIEDARSVSGVVSVRSYIQTMPRMPGVAPGQHRSIPVQQGSPSRKPRIAWVRLRAPPLSRPPSIASQSGTGGFAP